MERIKRRLAYEFTVAELKILLAGLLVFASAILVTAFMAVSTGDYGYGVISLTLSAIVFGWLV